MENQISIGIDLGTSNCALALASTATKDVQIVDISQAASPDLLVEKKLLPSAAYLPHSAEFSPSSFRLPWQLEPNSEQIVIGTFARERGALVPDRLVSSAKSWLCNPNIDRRSAILPWKSEIEEARLSPIAASRLLLEHLKQNLEFHRRALGEEFSAQDCKVVLAVPASFDEVARTLTHEAADHAGWGQTVLLEEPLAAFYSWIAASDEQWRSQVQPGDIVLVCDVGGGTADFSLVAVLEKQGELALHRISVGDHILLGGDNMDLALAFTLRRELEQNGHTLSNWQFLNLVHATREAKERLLSDPSLDDVPLAIADRGSSLFAEAISCRLTKAQCSAVLLDGFIPFCSIEDRPLQRRTLGLQEFGLPYAADPALSKHLARFLTDSRKSAQSDPELNEMLSRDPQWTEQSFVRPTCVLFNGGVFKSELIRHRVLDVINSWSPDAPVRELTGTELDLAVAKGAAYYGRILAEQKGLRIRAGISRSYYVGLESSMPAVPGYSPPVKGLCVVPQGSEEGSESVLENMEFGLITGEPVEFRFFSSNKRPEDKIGSLVEDAERELEETARLAAILPAAEGASSEQIPVKIHSVVTELGMLELWMYHSKTDQRWKFDFNLRARS